MRAPLSRAATDAETRAREVIAQLPASRRRALSDPPLAEALLRARALAAANRHEQAEEAFAAVVARARDEDLRCEARLGQGRAIYYRRQRGRAAAHLSEVARECTQTNVRAWARYLAAKGFASGDQYERALEQYALLEEQVAAHSLADDARYRSALIEIERGNDTEATRRLTSMLDDYPEGDMRGVARFMLAWRARARGDHEAALEHLDETIAAGPLEDREDLHGRAAYWRACSLAALERLDEAQSAWTEVVERHPLSYYAFQSLSRLEERSPAAAETARARLGRRGEPTIRFAHRAELEEPAFARALELFIVGEPEKARRELAWLRARSEAPDELRWIEAALLDRAGEHAEAVYITRRHLPSFHSEPPSGEHFARWRIAYPRAFAPEIEDATRMSPVPAELVFAIAREESSFRPEVVSIAHAYGLTQLIVPTARRFGRRIGLNVNAAVLSDPRVNVRIGAEYMSWLWRRYEENPVVLPSAYNAGQGATDRWLRERPSQRLDEWIEDIPYDETRRYTRRVLQTWGVYTWLDRGEAITLPAALPPR